MIYLILSMYLVLTLYQHDAGPPSTTTRPPRPARATPRRTRRAGTVLGCRVEDWNAGIINLYVPLLCRVVSSIDVDRVHDCRVGPRDHCACGGQTGKLHRVTQGSIRLFTRTSRSL